MAKVSLYSPLYSTGAGDNIGDHSVEGPKGGKSAGDPLSLNHVSGGKGTEAPKSPDLRKD